MPHVDGVRDRATPPDACPTVTIASAVARLINDKVLYQWHDVAAILTHLTTGSVPNSPSTSRSACVRRRLCQAAEHRLNRGSPPPTVASIGPASSPGLGLQCLVPWWPWEKPWPTAGRGDRHAHGTATDGRGRSIGDHSLNPTALTAQVMILSSCMVPVTPMASMMRPWFVVFTHSVTILHVSTLP